MQTYDPREQDEVAEEFAKLLLLPTKDGAVKRAKGEKVSWKIDDTHMEHFYNHLNAWEQGSLEDKDSGAHPLVHLAWRALAVAWQDMYRPDNESDDEELQRQLNQAYF